MNGLFPPALSFLPVPRAMAATQMPGSEDMQTLAAELPCGQDEAGASRLWFPF